MRKIKFLYPLIWMGRLLEDCHARATLGIRGKTWEFLSITINFYFRLPYRINLSVKINYNL